jgi:hypothetical protein
MFSTRKQMPQCLTLRWLFVRHQLSECIKIIMGLFRPRQFGCPGFSNLRLPFSQSATFHSFSLADSSTRRFAFSCRFVSRMTSATSCDLCISMVGTTYFQRIFTYFIALKREDCTRPTSDQFDLKSTTWSQMTKRTSDDPNVRLGRR